MTFEAVRERVEETIGSDGSVPSGSPPFTSRTEKVVELSLREAVQLGAMTIARLHVTPGMGPQAPDRCSALGQWTPAH